MIKQAIRSLAQRIVSNRLLWNTLGPLFRCIPYFQVQRSTWEHGEFIRTRNAWFADNACVQSGPFAGLRYPTLSSSGSVLWSKLLGVYEKEIFPVVASWPKKGYRIVLDWGCAEGYYLVGVSRMLPRVKAIGVDPDSEARRRAQKLAAHNRITSERISLRTSSDLSSLKDELRERSLVICDCEGYERELFSADINTLINADVLVECHDFISPGTTEFLLKQFGDTHDCEIIVSKERTIDDWPLKDDSILGLSVEQRLKLMDEGRPERMNWIWAQARRATS